MATILTLHGRYVTPVDLAKEIEFGRTGSSSNELLLLADRHGLEAKLIRLEPGEFDRITQPCIAYVKSEIEAINHNVVIFRVSGNKIFIGDPAHGKRTLTLARFTEDYLGLLLILRPRPDFLRAKISRSYLMKFLSFVGEHRFRIGLVFSIGLIVNAIGFGLIYLSKYFVDRVLPANSLSFLVLFALAYFLARAFNVAVSGLNSMLTVNIRNAVNRLLSERYFYKILGLEKKHIDSRDQGDFLHQFSQIETLTDGIASYFSQFVLVIFGMLIKTGFLLWLYDPLLVGLIMTIIAFNAGAGFLFARMTAESSNRQGMVFAFINSTIINSIADIRVVRVFRAADWVLNRYRKHLDEGLALIKKVIRLNVWGKSLADLFLTLSEAAIFIICGLRIIDGSYTVGDFLVFLTFSQGLAAESSRFPELVLSFQAQLRAFARVQAVFELTEEPNGSEKTGDGGMEIEFRNVIFGYQKETPVLRDVSFILEKGRTSAFVGESGSGKTTIMNLILGFYKPSSGTILVNGVDLAKLDLDDYRKTVSAVFQDTALFNHTLYQNAALGQPEVTRERVVETAKTLGIDEWIRTLPQKYDTYIYQGGLSGGQTQRVGILRALSKHFRLLIMDEATSNLDSQTEDRIVQGIESLCRGKITRVMIAHRLSTVMKANKIIVMKQGRVVEMGSHAELVEKKGSYLALIQRQYEVNLAPESLP